MLRRNRSFGEAEVFARRNSPNLIELSIVRVSALGTRAAFARIGMLPAKEVACVREFRDFQSLRLCVSIS